MHEVHLMGERIHLARYSWQFRTECGRFIPTTASLIGWQGSEENVCAICLRRAKGHK